ncbi:MAG: M3 family metallopeptidase [Thermoplasmata archaeon]|nr:M3 family metallopeptidase [Thermoplasmata archaeon]
MEKRNLALIIAAVVIVAAAACVVVAMNNGDDDEQPHATAFPETVTQESRELPSDPDAERASAQALIDQFTALAATGTSDEIAQGITDLYSVASAFSEVRAWATVYYNMDPTTYESAYTSWNEIVSWYVDAMMTAMHEAVGGDNADNVKAAITAAGASLTEIESYAPESESVQELRSKETELTTQYTTVVSTDYTYTYNGRTWTVDSVDSSTTLTDEQKAEIRAGIYNAKYTDAAEVYVELVGVRNDLAQALGYENYLDYSYSALYGRGYTYSDVSDVLQTTLTSASVFDSLRSAFTDGTFSTKDLDAISTYGQDWNYSTLESFTETIDGTMSEFVKYMEDNGLVYTSGDGIAGGFTTNLRAEHSAVVYIGYADYTLFTTMVHEMGHAADAALTVSYGSECMDIAEIQSQALEGLFCLSSSDYIGELSDTYTANFLLNVMYTLYMGSAVTDLEIWAYTTEASGTTLTVDALCEHYAAIQEATGVVIDTRMDSGLHWASVGHLFRAPGYYVSYVTSVLNAMEIFNTASENWDQGVEMYKYILYQTIDDGYVNTVTAVGLSNMLDSDNASKVLENLKAYVDALIAAQSPS